MFSRLIVFLQKKNLVKMLGFKKLLRDEKTGCGLRGERRKDRWIFCHGWARAGVDDNFGCHRYQFYLIRFNLYFLRTGIPSIVLTSA